MHPQQVRMKLRPDLRRPLVFRRAGPSPDARAAALMCAKVNAESDIDCNAWPSWTAADVRSWLQDRCSQEGWQDGTSWTEAILPSFEAAGIDGPTLLELSEDDLKDVEGFDGVKGIARRKAFLSLVRTLPRSSSNEALNDYFTAGETLAIVYTLVLSVVVGLLAGPPDVCDGQYEGENASTR